MKISVIHPTVRPEKAIAIAHQWNGAATVAGESYEYILVRDIDGPPIPEGFGYRVMTADGKGMAHCLNFGARNSTGEILMMGADDYHAPVGWNVSVIEAIADTMFPKVLAVSDGLRTDNLLCHPIMTRRRFDDQGGVMFHPDYDACTCLYADNEHTTRAYADEVVIEARGIKFDHRHAMFTGDGSTADQIAKEHNCKANYELGRKIYEARNPSRSWGKVAVGCRWSDAIDPAFVWSWSTYLMAGRRPGDVILNPSVRLPHATACNFLAWQFIEDTDCDSLLFIDDDMQFLPDDLTRLCETGFEFDVMGALCCCRRNPHRPIVLDGVRDIQEDGSLSYFRSSKPIEGIMPVHMVGFGFTLIRRWVIEKLAAEFKKSHWFVMDPDRGEDGRFSELARKYGAKLAINSTVSVGHRINKTAYHEAGVTVIGDNSFGLITE